MLRRFVDEWIPLENRYFEETGTESAADMIVDTALLTIIEEKKTKGE